MSWPIFISYRRGSTAAAALALWQALARKFGRDAAFLDVEHIGPGDVFRANIEFALSSCEVMLVVIGENWAPPRLSVGEVFGDRDFVQHEVASALRRGVHVMPILVNGASLPDKKEIPNELRSLVEYQAFSLRQDQQEADLQVLVSRLTELVDLSDERARQRNDSSYAVQMSRLVFPNRPLTSLARDVAGRIEDGQLPQQYAAESEAPNVPIDSDPEAALQTLNAIAESGGSEAEIINAQLDVVDAFLDLGEYPNASAVLNEVNDDINTITQRVAKEPRFKGLEVDVIVRAGVDVEPWMIKAKQRATLAVPMFQDSGVTQAIARFHTTAGRYFSALGDIDVARQYFYEAVQYSDATTDIEGLIVNLLNLGDCDLRSNRLDAAEGRLRTALRWAEAFDSFPLVADATTRLGNLYKQRGRNDLAREMLEDALEIAERLEDVELVAESGRELALVYFDADELDKAEELHRRVLGIERNRRNSDGIARQHHNLASVYVAREEYTVAEGIYRQALQTNRAIGRTEGVALQLTNLGSVLWKLDRADEAREVLREALTLNEQLQLPRRIAETCVNLGIVEAGTGNSDRATELFQRSVDLTTEGPYGIAAEALVKLADIRESRGELELAVNHYHQLLVILQRLGKETRRGGVLTMLGLLLEKLGRGNEALRRFQEAREIFVRHDMGSAAEDLEKVIQAMNKGARQ